MEASCPSAGMLTSMASPTARAPVVWSPATREHVPGAEVWVGVPTPGTEVPERVDVIRAVAGGRRAPAGRGARRTTTSRCWRCTTPTWSRTCVAVHDEWMAGDYVELVGQDRVVPYVFPTEAMLGGLPVHRAAAVHARAGQFGYDTMTLVGAGTWAAARAAVDCALTAVDLVGEGAAAGVRAVPPARPPRDPVGVRRLLLPQQRGGRRPGAARRRARAGGGRRPRRPPRQRDGGDLLRRAATCSTGRCTSTRAPAGSRTSSGFADETGTGAGRGRDAQPAARAGHR